MKQRLIIPALLIIFLFFSCLPGNDADAKDTITAFLDALLSHDQETLSLLAPEFAALDNGRRESLADEFRKYDRHKIEELKISGNTGYGIVVFSSGGDSLRIQVPLEYERDGWRIGGELRSIRTIDFIPAE